MGKQVKGFNIDINLFSTRRVHRDRSGIVQIKKFEYDVLPFDGYYNDNIIDAIMSQQQLNWIIIQLIFILNYLLKE